MFEQKNEILLFLVTNGNLTLVFHMGINSITSNKLWPLVARILNRKEVNMFGQLIGVYSSGLIWLIHCHLMIFVSVRDLFVKGKEV